MKLRKRLRESEAAAVVLCIALEHALWPCRGTLSAMRKVSSVLVLALPIACIFVVFGVGTSDAASVSWEKENEGPAKSHSADKCSKEGQTCHRTAGRAVQEHRPCCGKSLTCSEDPLLGSGHLCIKNAKREGTPRCAKDGKRCMSERGSRNVMYRNCCQVNSSCIRDPALGEGYFCKADDDGYTYRFSVAEDDEKPLRRLLGFLQNIYDHEPFSTTEAKYSAHGVRQRFRRRRQVSGGSLRSPSSNTLEGVFSRRAKGMIDGGGDAGAAAVASPRLGPAFGCATADSSNLTMEAPAMNFYGNRRSLRPLQKNQNPLLITVRLLAPETNFEKCVFDADTMPMDDAVRLLEVVSKVAKSAISRKHFNGMSVECSISLLENGGRGEFSSDTRDEERTFEVPSVTSAHGNAAEIAIGIRLLLQLSADSSDAVRAELLYLARQEIVASLQMELLEAMGRPSAMLSVLFSQLFWLESLKNFVKVCLVLLLLLAVALLTPIYLAVASHFSFSSSSRRRERGSRRVTFHPAVSAVEA